MRNLVQLIQPFLLYPESIRILKIAVDSEAIGLYDACSIVDALHASLDFQTIDAAADDLIKIRHETHIARIENIGAAFVLFQRKILPRPFFLHKAVFPSAGLRTASAVRVTSREIIAHETAPRIRDAHSAMDEHFQIHRTFLADLGDFLQGHLPRKHHARGSQLLPGIDSTPVGRIRLRTHMQLKLRYELTRHGKNTQIRNQHSIRADFCQIL